MSATQEHTRRPVHAGGQMKHEREARRNGRPTPKFSRDGETGPRRKPQWVCKGSPSMREARHRQYTDTLGSRSTPEAKRNTTGKPVRTGGPYKDHDHEKRGGRPTPEAPMGV